jgi:indole-3-glycerol phosphate synthase
MKRNLTIQLEESLIKRAKIIAAIKDESISKVVARELEKYILTEDQYGKAKAHALSAMKKGYKFGGKDYPKRDALYER